MNLSSVYSTTTSTRESKVGKTSSNTSSTKASSESAVNTTNQDEEASAVYEKNTEDATTKKVYKQDTATIAKLKEEAEKRTSQLRDLVEKMLLKQGQTLEDSNFYSLLREGKVEVDPETAAQAQADSADDGYWGVEQTSDRLVSFAMALSGGDPSKADEMMSAIQKGFDDATKAWGDELPDICKRTLEATKEKIEKWKNSNTAE